MLGPDGRVVTGDPAHVPVGIYAEQALKKLGIWTRCRYTSRVRMMCGPLCCWSSEVRPRRSILPCNRPTIATGLVGISSEPPYARSYRHRLDNDLDLPSARLIKNVRISRKGLSRRFPRSANQLNLMLRLA
jgi:hypothetical protein